MSKTTDDAVMELLRKVETKKKEIANASKKPQWKTNCTIGYNPEITSDRVNIMTIKDLSKLADLYAFLFQKEEYMEIAAKEMGFEVEHNQYMGYPISDWKEDLKTRAGQLMVQKKKEELDILDKRVNSLVSADQRREMELIALTQALGD